MTHYCFSLWPIAMGKRMCFQIHELSVQLLWFLSPSPSTSSCCFFSHLCFVFWRHCPYLLEATTIFVHWEGLKRFQCPQPASAGVFHQAEFTNILANPITSWQIDGEKIETVTNFIFLSSKITATSDCSHEIKKRCLFLGRKAITNLDSILKSRDITLPTKVLLVKAMVFPVAMYGCKSWTIKKAERWRIDAFELSCWRRLLRVPWTARRSNQSILKEISSEYSLERLMLKLKLQ